ncbi:MAG: hypothetical protein HYT09_03615 [Candidatus Levybacteria bacterium]|nr:hypothetical protein [Candidatus Levybacteria bacterium]
MKKRFMREGPRVVAAAFGVFVLLLLIGRIGEIFTPFKADEIISLLIGLIVLIAGLLMVKAAGPYQEEMQTATERPLETERSH